MRWRRLRKRKRIGLLLAFLAMGGTGALLVLHWPYGTASPPKGIRVELTLGQDGLLRGLIRSERRIVTAYLSSEDGGIVQVFAENGRISGNLGETRVWISGELEDGTCWDGVEWEYRFEAKAGPSKRHVLYAKNEAGEDMMDDDGPGVGIDRKTERLMVRSLNQRAVK